MSLPEEFAWVEHPRQEGLMWEGFRSSLVNFVAFSPDASPHPLGTGFVVGVIEGGFLLVLTAKHVLMAAIDVQSRTARRAAATTPLLFDDPVPDAHPDRMAIVWMGEHTADMLTLKYANFSPELDIAVCLLQCQEHLRKKLASIVPVIPIDLTLPRVGQEIKVVALGGISAKKVSDKGPARGEFRFTNHVAVRTGHVVSIEERSMGHRGKSFRTTIPTPGGMSGGFAFVSPIGETIAACGIVSHSDSEDDDITDFRVSGNSTIVDIYGAMALLLPTFLADNAPKQTLASLVHAGEVKEVSGLARYLSWAEDARTGLISINLAHPR